ncbi:DHA2 family efflux MFS transporter permease subunit [Paramagnetospirillum magneticum]|uniref:Permease of the major facilitator superfamily n=1 Tax=Paramagnetospirillum magneticum (strain ATCC 700264 / AMB-1) TaxID=342108 RepID=Q2W022_PARM1|nr:DHA2 family efflux MFS transporter permease subunit [Paramagnetospirillum magneticum]BAE52803.1 Permease of the major facilitator superfamily [Paramagnetospirillum magneticum AMB-1]
MTTPPLNPHDRVVTPRDWVGFMAMVVGMFMAILDIQIVASSIAQIQAGISASAEEISWVQTSYLIAEVVMIPLSGWLARVVSTRYLFFASCVTFTVASAACAVSWSIESMIAFRAIQGFLGGAMIPTVFATSYMIFPPRQQATMSVVIGLTATMAPTIGPTLGGWLTETWSWHWLFLVNVVPGVLVATLVYLFGRKEEPRLHMLKGFDMAGIALVAVFLGALQYVLEEGPGDDWFEDRRIVLVSLISLLAGLGFVWRELTSEHPVVDLRAFSDSNFAVGCLYSFIIGIGLYGSVYVIPLYLGRVRGYSALEIGLTMMVTGAFQALSAPLAGNLARHVDLRYMLGMGLALFGGGLWLNSALTSEWGYWEMFLPQAVRGLSLMFCFVPINAVALGHLPQDKVQNASGLYNLMRNLGGAIGLAAINTALTHRLDLHLLRLSETLTAARGAATGMLEGLSARLQPLLDGGADRAALKLLSQLARREAMTMAFGDVLMLMAAVFALGLLLLPLLQPVRHPSAGGDGH